MSAWVVLASIFAAAGQDPTSLDRSRTDSAIVFELPLPGEMLPTEGSGILVQAKGAARSVELRWTGPEPGSTQGEPQGFGYFRGQTGPIGQGAYELLAVARDSVGQILSRRSIRFRVGTPRSPSDTSTKAIQTLYVSASGGYRGGMSEDPLVEYRTLELSGDGTRRSTDPWATLDRNVSYSNLVQYDFQQRDFRLRAKASSDLSETWGHAPSPTRFGLDLAWGSWAAAHIGDQYPMWSNLLMDGSRIRGLGLSLAVPKGGESFVRFDAAVGESREAIDPQVRDYGSFTDTLPTQFARSIQAFHMGLGTGRVWNWNVAAVHSIDDTLGTNLALHDSLHGPSVRENIGLGTDFTLRLFQSRLELFSAAALSLTTDDLRKGDDLDSLNARGDISMPSFTSGLFTVNLSTKGSERLAGNAGSTADFVLDNLASRSGARANFPIDGVGRLRLETRWVHFGQQFTSFARSSQELSRTGLEWNASGAFARERFLVDVSGTLTDNHPYPGSTVPGQQNNVAISWSSPTNIPSFHAESGTNTSGGGSQPRIEAWNAGGGVYGTQAVASGSLGWRLNYSFTNSMVGLHWLDSLGTSTELTSEVNQHSIDAGIQWRPVRDFEWRTSYQLTDVRVPSSSRTDDEDVRHRVQGGASVWIEQRRWEIGADAGLYLVDQSNLDVQGWDQQALVRWEITKFQDARATQRYQVLSDRADLRIEAVWEAWF